MSRSMNAINVIHDEHRSLAAVLDRLHAEHREGESRSRELEIALRRWDEIDDAFAGNADPLLGTAAGDEYEVLFPRLAHLAPPPIGLGAEPR